MKQGIGFTGALTILFIALKLIGHITWSWLWVLAPLWIPWAIVVVILLATAGVFLMVRLVKFLGKNPVDE